MKHTAGAPGAGLKDEIRRRLVEQRRGLLRTLATTDEEWATFDAEEPGERGRGAAMAETTGLVLSRLSGRERHELDEITDALSRLEADSYGLCERCGRAIALARLQALPATRHCLECQLSEEAQPS
jgi:RNA polymerase-binding protein DksA